MPSLPRNTILFFTLLASFAVPSHGAADSSSLELVSYNHVYRKRDFRVASSLTLTFDRRYDLIVRPRMNRWSDAANHRVLESLPTGNAYRLRGIFAAVVPKESPDLEVTDALENFEDLRYLVGFEQEVKTDRKGEIHLSLTLPVDFTEQPLLTSRFRIFLELSPKGANETFLPVTASSTFEPLHEQGGGELIPIDFSMVEIQSRLVPSKIGLKTWTIGSARIFKPNFAPQEIDVETLFLSKHQIPGINRYALESEPVLSEPFPKIGWHTNLLRDFIESERINDEKDTKHLMLSLCGLLPRNRPLISEARKKKVLGWVSVGTESAKYGQSEFERCVAEPGNFFKLASVEFAKAIHGRPKLLQSSGHHLVLAADYTYQLTDGEKSAKGNQKNQFVEAAADAKTGFELFGIGGGVQTVWARQHRWYQESEVSKSEEHRNHIRYAELRSLHADELEFEIPMTVKSCLVVKSLRPLKNTNVDAMFCLSYEKKGVDSWYYITDRDRSLTPQGDDKDPRGARWLKLVRGRKQFEKLKAELADRTRHVRLERVMTSGFELDPLAAEFRIHSLTAQGISIDGGIFPGVLQTLRW